MEELLNNFCFISPYICFTNLFIKFQLDFDDVKDIEILYTEENLRLLVKHIQFELYICHFDLENDFDFSIFKNCNIKFSDIYFNHYQKGNNNCKVKINKYIQFTSINLIRKDSLYFEIETFDWVFFEKILEKKENSYTINLIISNQIYDIWYFPYNKFIVNGGDYEYTQNELIYLISNYY